jgi:hypothetical protein
MKAHEFLKSKIGHYDPTHPFLQKDVDYEDIEKWLDEYAGQQRQDPNAGPVGCDVCGFHPKTIIRTEKGTFCSDHVNSIIIMSNLDTMSKFMSKFYSDTLSEFLSEFSIIYTKY